MEDHEHSITRVRALDGTSFRLEKRGEALFVNGMLASTHALPGRVVALVTEHKTVQVSAIQYWEIMYGDVVPTKLLAGVLLAQLHEQRARFEFLSTRIMAFGSPEDESSLPYHRATRSARESDT